MDRRKLYTRHTFFVLFFVVSWWNDSKLTHLEHFTAAVIQRLGYLLDYIGETELADALYGLLQKTGKTFRKVPLKQSVPVNNDMPVNGRWKIIENYKLEIDEI